MSNNFYLDNDDLRFYIEQAFDWSEIVALIERNYSDDDGFRSLEEAKEFYRDIFDNFGKYVATEVAPKARLMDQKHPQLKNDEVVISEEMASIFDGFREMGLYALNLPRELGGLNAPFTTYLTIVELLSRADVSLVGHYGFHGGIALSLLAFAMKEGAIEHKGEVLLKTRYDDVIAEIAEGQAFGCMVLTEPDAGSDLSAIRAKAVLGSDGKWRLSGQKIFITSGQGQHQLVLAKSENTGNGLKDLSLFLVPRIIERDGQTIHNVEIERLEEKIGLHASITCTLNYDESEAELVGKRGQGFELMLQLMNNARLGVGFEGIGLIEAAYRLALAYAKERKSMGKALDQHEMIADYLDKISVELKGLRAMAFSAAYAVDLLTRIETKLQLAPPSDPKERMVLEKRLRSLKWKARGLTPTFKYLAAEKAVELSRIALQIHGGVGYTTDYLIEKLVRDAMVLPIYEGTSQIQALMSLKDQLQGAIKDPGRFIRRKAQAHVNSISARNLLDRKLAKLETRFYGALQHILTRIARDKWHLATEKRFTEWANAFLKDWDPKRDFAYGMLHAERVTRILAHCQIARILVDQARKFPERRSLALSYIERVTPEVNFLYDEIQHLGDRLLSQLNEAQGEADSKSAS